MYMDNIYVLILMIIFLIAGATASLYYLFTTCKILFMDAVDELTEIAEAKFKEELDGGCYTLEEINAMKYDFTTDFENNIRPIIESEIDAFIINYYVPDLYETYGYAIPVDTFVKKHADDFIRPLIGNISLNMKRYMSRYMPFEMLDMYTARIAFRDLKIRLVELEKKYGHEKRR